MEKNPLLFCHHQYSNIIYWGVRQLDTIVDFYSVSVNCPWQVPLCWYLETIIFPVNSGMEGASVCETRAIHFANRKQGVSSDIFIVQIVNVNSKYWKHNVKTTRVALQISLYFQLNYLFQIWPSVWHWPYWAHINKLNINSLLFNCLLRIKSQF